MKLQYPRLLAWCSSVLLSALLSSCATPLLWQATKAREWGPCSLDQAWLLTNTNQQHDVAVLFSQSRAAGKKSITRTVGWQVSQVPDHLACTAAAIRRLTNAVSEVKVIPIYHPGTVPPDASSQPPGYVVATYEGYQFEFHVNGVPSGPYVLPSTRDTFNTVRVVLLPVAVATDASLITIMVLGSGHGNIHFGK